MNAVWHEHFFVPGGDQDRERFDAVEYENGNIYVVDVNHGEKARCYSRDFARRVAMRMAGVSR